MLANFKENLGFPASLTVSARMVINLHDLNNEGSEGNYLHTRMVTVVNPKGELQNVNAISGDMFKHIIVAHFQRIALDQSLPLCEGCKKLDPNRISVDEHFKQEANSMKNAEIVSAMIKRCAIDDIFGNMYTGGKKSVARKSAIEIGWVVGLPENTSTESYLHTKFVKGENKQDTKESANLKQNLFHRPANSGIYALVLNIDFTRIGWNDITCQYDIDETERKHRAKALVESVVASIVRPEGAMRNTQLPHITAMEGVVSISDSASVPAPNISPLNNNYIDEMSRIEKSLNDYYVEAKPISANVFESIEGFVDYIYKIAGEIK